MSGPDSTPALRNLQGWGWKTGPSQCHPSNSARPKSNFRDNRWTQGAFPSTPPLIAIIAYALAGCATEPPKLLTEVKTIEVRVPVPVPCQVAIPKRPTTAMPDPSADVARLAAGASADVRALALHADQLEAALIGCGGKP